MDDLNRPDPLTVDGDAATLETGALSRSDTGAVFNNPADADAGALVEPGAEAGSVASEDAEATTARPPVAHRRRWVIASAVSILAIAGAIAGVLLLNARPLPGAYGYLPADSAVVLEVRPELPGDQRARLGTFLAHFPGFADQSRLSEKLDETLDRLVRSASGGGVDYATRVKPLLTGPIVVGLAADTLRAMDGTTAGSRGLIVATIKNGTTCDTILGPTTDGGAHRGVDIRDAGVSGACAVDGQFLLFGDASSVKAGIDAHLDHSGLDSKSSFADTRGRLQGDQLALAYVDGSAFRQLVGSLGAPLGLGSMAEAAIPDWIVAGLRVEDDALSLTIQADGHPTADLGSGVPSEAPASTSAFASMLPADTIGFIEIHGAGAAAQRMIAGLAAAPANGAGGAQLQGALGVLNGASALISGIEDVGVAVLPGDTPGGVLLVRAKDAQTAAAQFAQVRNLLALASIGTDITLRDTDHAGVRITTVDLGDITSLLGTLGLKTQVPTTNLTTTFSLAVRDQVLMVGLGDGVIERLLDVPTGSSLATSTVYRRSVDLTGSSANMRAFVALDGILGLIEKDALTGADQDAYRREMKPYLDHLAGAGWTTTNATTGGRSRLVIIVK